MNLSVREKKGLIEPSIGLISLQRQCSLINLPRSSYYYHPIEIPLSEIEIMHKIDRLHTKLPFYGSPRITAALRREGEIINHKKVERLMKQMGIFAVRPKKTLSGRANDHLVYPYLLRNLKVSRKDQVWSSDITYIPLYEDYVYLVAVIDWYSRYVLSWAVSNTLDVYFCLDALEQALITGKPEIFNTDQGSQFTSSKHTGMLIKNNIQISMDSRGRYFDNIFIERLWRSVKYEDVYLRDYQSVREVISGIDNYFNFYNYERPHQSLKYSTPAEIYLGEVH